MQPKTLDHFMLGNKMFDFNKFMEKYRSVIEYTGMSRMRFYEFIIPRLVSLNRPIYVMETGTMYTPSYNHTCQGAFTEILSDLIVNWTGGKLYTVDISKEHLDLCKIYTQRASSAIEYTQSDSVEYLKNLTDDFIKNVDLFYFDSYDIDCWNPIPSENHHFNELISVYFRLSKNCILAVDDNFLPNTYIKWYFLNPDGTPYKIDKIPSGKDGIGKGKKINTFLLNNGWERHSENDIPGENNLFFYHRKIN